MLDAGRPKVAYLCYCGVIDQDGVKRIAQALNGALNRQFDSAYLCISSHGGGLDNGIYLFNLIRGLSMPVTIHNIGTVNSIAATFFLAGETRYCSKHAVFIMQPIKLVEPSGPSVAEQFLPAIQVALVGGRTDIIFRERTKIPEDVLAASRQDEVYLTAEEALRYALVHEIREFSLPAGNEIYQI